MVLSICHAEFKDNGNNTVTDIGKGLMWQKIDNGALDWQASIDYCDELVLAGFSDWRLPHIKEIHSIVDYSGKNSYYTDTTIFPYRDEQHWSSTTIVNIPSNAWWVYVGISPGSNHSNKSEAYGVRCVRSGD
jgi:hypothetical protein